jgi:hypothetical protein
MQMYIDVNGFVYGIKKKERTRMKELIVSLFILFNIIDAQNSAQSIFNARYTNKAKVAYVNTTWTTDPGLYTFTMPVNGSILFKLWGGGGGALNKVGATGNTYSFNGGGGSQITMRLNVTKGTTFTYMTGQSGPLARSDAGAVVTGGGHVTATNYANNPLPILCGADGFYNDTNLVVGSGIYAYSISAGGQASAIWKNVPGVGNVTLAIASAGGGVSSDGVVRAGSASIGIGDSSYNYITSDIQNAGGCLFNNAAYIGKGGGNGPTSLAEADLNSARMGCYINTNDTNIVSYTIREPANTVSSVVSDLELNPSWSSAGVNLCGRYGSIPVDQASGCMYLLILAECSATCPTGTTCTYDYFNQLAYCKCDVANTVQDPTTLICSCASNTYGSSCTLCPATCSTTGAVCDSGIAGTGRCRCPVRFRNNTLTNTCEEDDCYINPCRNGGVCHDGIGSYQCECAGTFYGTNCTLNSSKCIYL